jgi:hypothetical protein
MQGHIYIDCWIFRASFSNQNGTHFQNLMVRCLNQFIYIYITIIEKLLALL